MHIDRFSGNGWGFAAVLGVLVLVCQTGCQSGDANRWKPLFNGRNLDGWHVQGEKDCWRAEEGAIVGELFKESPYAYLVTDRSFGDFELKMQMCFDSAQGNSGIFFHSSFPPYCPRCEYNVAYDQPESDTEMVCEEHGRVQVPPLVDRVHIKGIQVEFAPPGHFTGGLYDTGGGGWINKDSMTEEKQNAHQFQQWNDLDLRVVGDHMTVHLNGMLISDVRDHPIPRKGQFALQLHSGGPMKVRFREIMVRRPE